MDWNGNHNMKVNVCPFALLHAIIFLGLWDGKYDNFNFFSWNVERTELCEREKYKDFNFSSLSPTDSLCKSVLQKISEWRKDGTQLMEWRMEWS